MQLIAARTSLKHERRSKAAGANEGLQATVGRVQRIRCAAALMAAAYCSRCSPAQPALPPYSAARQVHRTDALLRAVESGVT
jgi:hypothetical protein